MQGDVIESAVAAAGQPDVEVRRTLVKGRAADTLMRVAEGADMLVVGNRGRGGFVGLRLGSVSQAIAHYRQAIHVNPRYAEAHHNLGIAFGAADNLDMAIKHLRLAVVID